MTKEKALRKVLKIVEICDKYSGLNCIKCPLNIRGGCMASCYDGSTPSEWRAAYTVDAMIKVEEIKDAEND